MFRIVDILTTAVHTPYHSMIFILWTVNEMCWAKSNDFDNPNVSDRNIFIIDEFFKIVYSVDKINRFFFLYRSTFN